MNLLIPGMLYTRNQTICVLLFLTYFISHKVFKVHIHFVAYIWTFIPPLFKDYLFLREGTERAWTSMQGDGQRERETQTDSISSVEPDMGLNPITPRLWPEAKPSVGCPADCTTEASKLHSFSWLNNIPWWIHITLFICWWTLSFSIFWLWWIMMLWTLVCESVWFPAFHSFAHTPRRGTAESHGNSLISFLKNCQNVLHSSCTILQSHQHFTKVSISQHPQHLLFSISSIITILKCIR